jgi:ribosomal RNA-processing protein 9
MYLGRGEGRVVEDVRWASRCDLGEPLRTSTRCATDRPIGTFLQALAFRKGSQQLYTASFDRTIKLFDLGVMGYVETLFGHQDRVLALDALRGETAVSVGGRDKTVRFWKIADESQLVFRGGGRSAVRELLEGGALEGLDEGEERRADDGKKFVEGSMECIAMVDETTFVSGGDSGFVSRAFRL